MDTSGTEAAQRAIAEAQTAATNLNKNFKTDLSPENITNVVAGGSADTIGADVAGMRKRKQASGLSSALGITG